MIKDLWEDFLSFIGLGDDCGCEDCDCKESEETEDVSGEKDSVDHLNPTVVHGAQDILGAETAINHINPVEVHGAQDIYGAEAGHGRVFGSRIGNYNYDTLVGSPPLVVPPNPRQYQTVSGLYHDTYMMDYNGNLRPAYGEIWDNWNDMLPEYRFPRPWSPSYNPRWAGRPQDYQVNQVNGAVDAHVTNMATHATVDASQKRRL